MCDIWPKVIQQIIKQLKSYNVVLLLPTFILYYSCESQYVGKRASSRKSALSVLFSLCVTDNAYIVKTLFMSVMEKDWNGKKKNQKTVMLRGVLKTTVWQSYIIYQYYNLKKNGFTFYTEEKKTFLFIFRDL